MHATQDSCDVGLIREPHATVVSVAGEVDLFAAPTLSAALARALAISSPIVVDLSDCTFFDSSGLNALLTAYLTAERVGCRVLVARPPASAPERVLSLTVPGQFPAHHTREDALAAIAA